MTTVTTVTPVTPVETLDAPGNTAIQTKINEVAASEATSEPTPQKFNIPLPTHEDIEHLLELYEIVRMKSLYSLRQELRTCKADSSFRKVMKKINLWMFDDDSKFVTFGIPVHQAQMFRTVLWQRRERLKKEACATDSKMPSSIPTDENGSPLPQNNTESIETTNSQQDTLTLEPKVENPTLVSNS